MRHRIRAVCLALLWAICQLVSAQEHEIAILSVGDMHAAIHAFPRFSTLVDSLRTVYPSLLLLSSGDNRTGHPINDHYAEPSLPMTQLMNACGFQASAVGNHEFDGGLPALQQQILRSDFPYLCANLFAPDTLPLSVIPFCRMEVDGVSVGVIGLIQLGSSGKPDAHPDHVSPLTFVDPKEAVARLLPALADCPVKILLSHCGYQTDVALAQEFPSVDLIIGGHSHMRLPEGVREGNVLITQAGSELRQAALTRLVVVDNQVIHKQTELIEIADSRPADPQMAAMVDTFSQESRFKEVVATVILPFDSKVALGNLVTDAYRKVTGADVVLQNSGGIRLDSLSVGPLTREDLFRLDPFDNAVVYTDLTGDELGKLLLACRMSDKHRLPAVSGFCYECVVDPSDSTSVKAIRLFDEDGHPLDLRRIYRVVTTTYVASSFAKASYTQIGKTSVSILLRYIHDVESLLPDPLPRGKLVGK